MCVQTVMPLLQVRNVRGEWREIAMSKHIKALVVLNLQSYAGGRDLWGLRDPKRDAAKGWQTPIFNDGLIEVRSPICTAHCVPALGGMSLGMGAGEARAAEG